MASNFTLKAKKARIGTTGLPCVHPKKWWFLGTSVFYMLILGIHVEFQGVYVYLEPK